MRELELGAEAREVLNLVGTEREQRPALGPEPRVHLDQAAEVDAAGGAPVAAVEEALARNTGCA